MSRETRLLTLALLGIIALFLCFQSYEKYVAPVSTARKIVDPESNYSEIEAQKKAIDMGERIIPVLVEQSSNFSKINRYNAGRIAYVLGKIETESTLEIAKELYSREDNWSRLAGAHALLHRDAFPEKILNRTSFLAKQLLDADTAIEKDPYTWGPKPSEMAAECIAHFDSSVTLPLFVEAAEAGLVPYHLCLYLSGIDSADAVPGLLACLKNCYANCETIAGRLLSLGEKKTIPALFNLLKDEQSDFNYKSQNGSKLLKAITGKDFGEIKKPWSDWWNVNTDTWEIPEEFRSPEALKGLTKASFSWLGLLDYLLGWIGVVLLVIVFLVFWEIRKSRKFSSKQSLGDEANAETTAYAGLGARLVASIVDSIIFIPLVGFLWLFNGSQELLIVYFTCVAFLPQIYQIYFHTKYGATFGKMLLKIQLFNLEGKPISLWQAVYRSFVYVVFAVFGLVATILSIQTLPEASPERLFDFLEFSELIKLHEPNWNLSLERVSLVWVCLEVIFILKDKRSRALHDVIAGTVVVHK